MQPHKKLTWKEKRAISGDASARLQAGRYNALHTRVFTALTKELDSQDPNVRERAVRIANGFAKREFNAVVTWLNERGRKARYLADQPGFVIVSWPIPVPEDWCVMEQEFIEAKHEGNYFLVTPRGMVAGFVCDLEDFMYYKDEVAATDPPEFPALTTRQASDMVRSMQAVRS